MAEEVSIRILESMLFSWHYLIELNISRIYLKRILSTEIL